MPDGPAQKPLRESLNQERFEKSAERIEGKPITLTEQKSTEERPSDGVVVIPAQPATATPVSEKSPLLHDIENILEENLVPLYKELSQKQKQQFKTEGERTARTIEILLKKAHVAVIEIIRLIRRWLRLIPGINIFFLEQEAKIKAERILALKKEEKSK